MSDTLRAASGTDVIVIGAGLAGLTAAVHAVKAGASVRLIAQGWGQQMVTPGWISIWDRAGGDVLDEVRDYAALQPQHPYSLVGVNALRDSIAAFGTIADEIGVPHDLRRTDKRNLRLPTLLGAVQTPMLAPRGLANGDLTGIDGTVLLVGFNGWRDFHPELAAGNLGAQGIDARAVSIDLPDPGSTWDSWPGDLAHLFDRVDVRGAVVRQLKTHLGGVAKIGFPAVLGGSSHVAVLEDLTAALERPVFEIATLPPGVPGTRLSNALRRWLLRHGARVQIGHPVVCGIVENARCTGVEVGALGHTNTFYGDVVILATGSLYNGGIQSDESGTLWEPVFDLPVTVPNTEGRAGWYYDRLLDPRGHPVHRYVGLRINAWMQPLGLDDTPLLRNVYAAGHILAGFNPLTDGCAEGIALGSAYKAVTVALEHNPS